VSQYRRFRTKAEAPTCQFPSIGADQVCLVGRHGATLKPVGGAQLAMSDPHHPEPGDVVVVAVLGVSARSPGDPVAAIQESLIGIRLQPGQNPHDGGSANGDQVNHHKPSRLNRDSSSVDRDSSSVLIVQPFGRSDIPCVTPLR
jgi:hypothetical protein